MTEDTYNYGELVTLTAKPDDCCEFLYWAEEENPCVPVSFENELTFIVSENSSYIPIFRKKQFHVNVTSNFAEFCCITGNGLYDCGTDVTIKIITSNCNEIKWDNEIYLTNTLIEVDTHNNTVIWTYTIENISEDFIESITLTLCKCTVNVLVCSSEDSDSSALIITGGNTPNHNTAYYICNENYSVPIDPCDYINVETHGNSFETLCGTEVTLIATPGYNSEFIGWIVSNEGCVDCNGPYISLNRIFSTVLTEENVTYVACFGNSSQIRKDNK